MRNAKLTLVLSVFLSWAISVDSIGPALGYLGGTALIGLGAVGVNFLKCYFYECCDENWIPQNFTGLKKALEEEIYGQPFAIKATITHLWQHFKSKDNPRPLVLSFHGPVGVGKTFLATFLPKYLYKQGAKSAYVRSFSATTDFPASSKIDFYKELIRDTVINSVRTCGKSLFIFEEMDKMHIGLIEVISGFLDFHKGLIYKDLDFSNSIFVFISNIGQNALGKKAKEYFENGVSRKDVLLKDVEGVLKHAAFNEKGGLKESGIVEKHLITAYIPFFPLEKSHVKKCVIKELKNANITAYGADLVDAVLSKLVFQPKNLEIFSESGCKLVRDKLLFVLEMLKEEEDEEEEEERSATTDDKKGKPENIVFQQH